MSNRQTPERPFGSVGRRSLARGMFAVLLACCCVTAGCTLEQPRVAVERTGALAWEYSGLDALATAEAAAASREALVLVGLSGSPG